MKPDLNNSAAVAVMVEQFYQKLLADQYMARVFLDVAGIKLEEHFPRIESYWCKMLFGEREYQRHMMQLHREVHFKESFEHQHFDTWLAYFVETIDELFVGDYAEKAKRIANNVIKNMRSRFLPASQ